MGRPAATGTCCICGSYGKLSFEHVPPKEAFNKYPLFYKEMENALKSNSVLPCNGGRTVQGGAGAYTLCERCNSNTGSWYGRAYVDWARRVAEALRRASDCRAVDGVFTLYPLQVVKQVVAMFFSANGGVLGDERETEHLVQFVLDRETRGIPDGLRVFAFYTKSPLSRQTGPIARGDIFKNEVYAFSEIAFRPLGFVLTFKSRKPDPRLTDITDFARFRYREKRRVHVIVPVLPLESWAPADFRTKDEILETARQTRRQIRTSSS